MKILKIVFFLVILTLSIAFTAKKEFEWNKIVPMETTREEVEKLFGKGKEIGTDEVRYDLKEGILIVNYSDGVCESDDEEDWNAQTGLVLNLEFNFEDLKDFGKFGIDKTKLKKNSLGECTPQLKEYVDEEKGISYELFEKEEDSLGEVQSIKKFPTKEFEFLRCDKFLKGE